MTERDIERQLRRLILLQYRLDDAPCDELIGNGDIIRVRKKQTVIERGCHNDNLYIIVDGIWRAYFDMDGVEKTMYFAVPGEPVFSSFSYFNSKASVYSVEASNDSVAWVIPKKKMAVLIDRSEDISHWFINVLGRLMSLTEESYIEMSTGLAEDRYRIFAHKMPYVLQNVPLKEIAAYLGVTPQSLSRIRAEMVRK